MKVWTEGWEVGMFELWGPVAWSDWKPILWAPPDISIGSVPNPRCPKDAMAEVNKLNNQWNWMSTLKLVLQQADNKGDQSVLNTWSLSHAQKYKHVCVVPRRYEWSPGKNSKRKSHAMNLNDWKLDLQTWQKSRRCKHENWRSDQIIKSDPTSRL